MRPKEKYFEHIYLHTHAHALTHKHIVVVVVVVVVVTSAMTITVAANSRINRYRVQCRQVVRWRDKGGEEGGRVGGYQCLRTGRWSRHSHLIS